MFERMENITSTSALNTPINPDTKPTKTEAPDGAANFLENIFAENPRNLDKTVLKGEDLKSEVLKVKEEQSLSVKAISRLANVDYVLLNKYLKTNQNAQRSAAMYNMEAKIREWLDHGDYSLTPVTFVGSPSDMKVRTRITFTSKENDLVKELVVKFPGKGAITSLIPALTERWNKERQANGLPLINKDQVYRKFANHLTQVKTQPDVKLNIPYHSYTMSSPRKVIRFTEEEKLHIDALLKTYATLPELLQHIPNVTRQWNIARSSSGLDLLTEEQVKGKLERTRQSHKFTATMAHFHQSSTESPVSLGKHIAMITKTPTENFDDNQICVSSTPRPGLQNSVQNFLTVFGPASGSGNCEKNESALTVAQFTRTTSIQSPTRPSMWISTCSSNTQESRQDTDTIKQILPSPQEEHFASDKDAIDLSPGTFSESSYEAMFPSRSDNRRRTNGVDYQMREYHSHPEINNQMSNTVVVHAESVDDIAYEHVDSDVQDMDTSLAEDNRGNDTASASHSNTRDFEGTVDGGEAIDDEVHEEERSKETNGSAPVDPVRRDVETTRVCEDDSGRGSFMSCEDLEGADIRSSHSEEEATGSVSQPSKKIRDVVHYQDPESLQKMACSFMNAASSKLVRQRDQYKELWLKCRKRLAQEEMMRKKATNDLKRQKLEYEEKLLMERRKSAAFSHGGEPIQEGEKQQLQSQINDLTEELKRERQKVEGLPDLVKSFLCAHLAIENTQVVLPFIKTEKF